jgi:hypothetical protein
MWYGPGSIVPDGTVIAERRTPNPKRKTRHATRSHPMATAVCSCATPAAPANFAVPLRQHPCGGQSPLPNAQGQTAPPSTEVLGYYR